MPQDVVGEECLCGGLVELEFELLPFSMFKFGEVVEFVELVRTSKSGEEDALFGLCRPCNFDMSLSAASSIPFVPFATMTETTLLSIFAHFC